jgi:hypothetical protein
MQSSANRPARGSRFAQTFETWNKKLHYYLGLYFLFFLWLFLLTGLMLNHGSWRISQAANQRVEAKYERAIDVPTEPGELAQAQDLMRQLGLVGEIDWPPPPRQPGRLDFNVARPNDASLVRVDLAAGRAFVDHFDNRPWAVFRIFHTFSGARYNVAGTSRDWTLTTLWVFAMDALAIGLVVMVLGSYYMWYRLKRTHTLGVLTLSLGLAACAMFLYGLVGG